jgi:hypothetical protein
MSELQIIKEYYGFNNAKGSGKAKSVIHRLERNEI